MTPEVRALGICAGILATIVGFLTMDWFKRNRN